MNVIQDRNTFLGVGLIGLVSFGLIVTLYFVNELKLEGNARDAQIDYLDEKVTSRIDELDKKVNTFIDNWETKQRLNNDVNNTTQTRLLNLSELQNEQEKQLINLAKNQTLILALESKNVKDILGNLTDHRHITNSSHDEIKALLNNTTGVSNGNGNSE